MSLFTVWNYVFLNPFRNVVKSFYTASLLYDVLTQFGELSQEVLITLGSLRNILFLIIYFLNSGWRDKGLEHFPEVCSETLACTTDKTKLLLNPSAKQRWNPCCRPPPEYQDLSMCHDWSFLKSHCQFANQANGETFCFPEKRLLSILNFVPRVTYCFFLRAADWPTTNFLGMYCYFPVIGLVNFV